MLINSCLAWNWDAFSPSLTFRPLAGQCDAIRTPVIESLFMPLSIHTGEPHFSYSRLYLGASIRDHGSLLFSPTNFLLVSRHSCISPGPRWPLPGSRGLSDYLRPQRNLESASAMPSHSNCRGMLQRRERPKHPQVASSRHGYGQEPKSGCTPASNLVNLPHLMVPSSMVATSISELSGSLECEPPLDKASYQKLETYDQ
jgi:hypothetical protein